MKINFDGMSRLQVIAIAESNMLPQGIVKAAQVYLGIA